MTRIGPYELGPELGRGGRGVVLRARGPDGREVALKVCRLHDREALARFRREIAIQRSLGEGFVPFLDAGDDPRGPWLVMPIAPGGTLRDRLHRGPLPRAEAVRLVTALARAMARAHRAGVVHRDLKPENVLFGPDGAPLIADMGLAKHWDAEPGGSLSRSGWIRGTFGYAAPEQIRDAKSVGPAADVFALGVILYECLAGARPFEGESTVEVAVRTTEGRATPLASRCPGLSRALEAVIERAIAKDPATRHADAGDLALALEATERPPARRSWRLAGALASCLALVAAAAALGATRGAPPPERPVGLALEATWGRLASRAWYAPGASYATVATSEDGRVVATGGAGGRLAVWDAATGLLRRELRIEPRSYVSSVALSPDGRVVRYVRGSGRRELLGEWRPDASAVVSETAFTDLGPAAFSRDGARLAYAEKGSLVVRDLAGGTVSRLPGRARLGGARLAVSGDSVVFARGSQLGSTAGDLSGSVDLGASATALAISGDARRVVLIVSRDSPGERQEVRAYPADLRGAPVAVPLENNAFDLAVSHDGRFAACGGEATVELFDLEAGRRIATHPVEGCGAVAFRGREASVLAVDASGSIHVVDARTGACEIEGTTFARGAQAIAVAADGRTALASWRGALATYDLAEGRERWRVPGPREALGDCVLLEGRAVAVARDGRACTIDLGTGVDRELRPSLGRVFSLVALAPDGARAALWPDRGEEALHLVDLAGGEPPFVVPRPDVVATGMTFAGPRTLLLSAELEGLVAFDLLGGPPRRRLVVARKDGLRPLRASRSGRRVAGVVDDVGRSQVASFALGETASLAQAGVRAVEVAVLDSGEVVVAGDDGSVRLIDAAGRTLATVGLPEGELPERLALTPDESAVLVATALGRVHRLRVLRS